MNREGECCTCSKWHVICGGVSADPSWNRHNGGCGGYRAEPLPAEVSCVRCTRDICAKECNAIRHGALFVREASEVCRWFEDDPKSMPVFIEPQRTLEAFL